MCVCVCVCVRACVHACVRVREILISGHLKSIELCSYAVLFCPLSQEEILDHLTNLSLIWQMRVLFLKLPLIDLTGSVLSK